ncbi:MAG: TIGR03668 family PPOX class F420-dependent oxidoreductase [Dehalococcoidia bacterium]|nr:TIGR03668 family PPOX class F420-dependent oxidoreductase [Dehalococcoidia bacterium]HCV00931.1 TIGR03668 family PPOX class F420-dependent oxidoreductase [Dehalococcoidia bacterium]|tara:strand:+ start:60 stop:497 length:438 start_codon:yes stop_codon:yes gene_type:complete
MEAWQTQLLEDERSGVLGTIGRNGIPQLVPVCFAFIEGDVAIAIDEKPKRGGKLARVVNMERDPRVTLLIDHYEERWEQLAWLRLECRAVVLNRGREWPTALDALRQRYPRYQEMTLESLPLIRLNLKRVVGWRWQDEQTSDDQV